MKKLLCVLLTLTAFADNEIYGDQNDSNLELNLEQLGSTNLIGGSDAVAGDMTPLDLDGGTMDLTINQIGTANVFRGDIFADTSTFLFDFDGSSNIFAIQVDPTNTYSVDNSDFDVDVDGSSNTFELNVGTTAIAENFDLDWVIVGSSNDFTVTVNSDESTQDIDVDGDSNVFNIIQKSTLASDWLQLITVGDSSNICIVQDDGGTNTTC